jgi:hypothetical protein
MLAKWRLNSDQRNLGPKREFLRNLPTTPTRAAQLRKGLEPIFESDDRCCRRHSMAVANVTDKTPASAEICNSTNRQVIDLGSHRPLQGSIWSTSSTFGAFSTDGTCGNPYERHRHVAW